MSNNKILDLKKLQQQFSQSLLYQSSDISFQVKEKQGFDVDQLLQIHRNNFVISVTESLKVTFKYTQELVGEEFFEASARQFLLQQPPEVNNICVYGKNFPCYLASLQQLLEMPYIAEMAKFEYLYEECQNLPLQQENIDLSALQQVEPYDFPLLQFTIASDCCTFNSKQNILNLLNMIKSHDVKETDLNQPCYLILKKQPNFNIEITEINEFQWQLIQQLQQQKTLGALHPSSLQNQLSDLLTLNLISGFTVNKHREAP